MYESPKKAHILPDSQISQFWFVFYLETLKINLKNGYPNPNNFAIPTSP